MATISASVGMAKGIQCYMRIESDVLCNLPPTGKRHTGQSGFTLVEPIAAVGILSMLLGTLLPAVQKTREASNHAKAISRLKVLVQAQKFYFQSHGMYAGSFDALGLSAEFPCADSVR